MSGLSKKNSDNLLKFVYSDNDSLSVIFHDNELLIGVVGEFNKNLKELEKITQTSLYSRGNSILIKSNPEKNEIVKNAIKFLANQFINNGSIENKDILSSVDNFMINEKVKNNNVTDIIKTPKKSIIPRSEKQKDYVRALRQSDIIISAGPAGTGKTFLAVAVGLTMLLEKITQTSLYSRGNSILIKSNPERNEIVKNALKFLTNQFINNGNIENKDILSSVDNFMIKEKVKNNNVTDIIKTPKKSIIPRSEKQKDYVRALRQSDIIISAGPAGTGKTFLAVAVGLTMLLEKKIERIILSRPAVEAGERLGFLPGDMKEKVDPYLRPLYDSLYDLFDFEKIQRMIEIGDIEIAPLAFMRGRTLKNSFAILDESQNATDTQIKMFLTRIGENSKIVVNGDPTQIDLPNKNMSGLVRSKELLGHLNEISVVDFDHSDVVRHPLVSKIVKAYSKND